MELATRYDSLENKAYIKPSVLSGFRQDVGGKLYVNPTATGGLLRNEAGSSYMRFNAHSHHVSGSYAIGGIDVPIPMGFTAQYGIAGRILKQINLIRRADWSLTTQIGSIRGRKRISDGSFVWLLTPTANYSTATASGRLIYLSRSANYALAAANKRFIDLTIRADYTPSAHMNRGFFLKLNADFFLGTIALARVPRTREQEEVDIGAILSGVKGPVNVRFKLFVSDKFGNELATLRVVNSASVSMSNFRDNTWELSLDMLATDILNPYTDYVMPAMDLLIRTRSGREYWERFPLGLYRFDVSGPSVSHSMMSSAWSLTGQSPEILLLGDTAKDGYTAPIGTWILATVRQILLDQGVPATRIDFPAKDKQLVKAMYFDPGKDAGAVYWLRICNALLSAGGYLSLFTDAHGYFKTQLYANPQSKVPDLNYGIGGDQIVVGEISDNFTESDFANRVVARSNDVNQIPPLVAVVVNDDPNSQASVQALGRTITKELSVQSVVSQDELLSIARDELSSSSGRYHKLSISSVPDPRIHPRQAMNLNLTNAEGKVVADGMWRIINQTIPLNGDRMSHELARSERWHNV